ncbi:hypothetical protein [Pseudoalteromonas sp. OOF1S-7]|uniref:hypothetical protein n=1 Tax=Pseudoalteromonas sp. OOF1S-7 TaxID=2917757 RepID=UPI001EF694B3|nr:hypothetical protein [Pseudoalteromonas sp. OOF1S-7]MCG7533384.1 hypothetical protein [Pseudoalteromonas sp. OOF1S-7]
MRFLLGSLVIALLAGCGGGSSEPTGNVTPGTQGGQSSAHNTAPTLKNDEGTWVISANMQSTKRFELSDKEGDPVSVSSENLPQWLKLDQTGTTLSLVAEPDLFDVDTHSIDFVLSDSKDTSAQTIVIQITADPESHPSETITLSDDVVKGTWSNQSGDVLFHFADDNKGLGLYKNQGFAFDWKNPDDIELTTREAECIAHCSRPQFLPIEVVAQQDDKIAVKIHASEQDYELVVLTKGDVKSLEYNYYIEQRLSDDVYVSKLSTSTSVPSLIGGVLTVDYEDYKQQVPFHYAPYYDGDNYQILSGGPERNLFGRSLEKEFLNTSTQTFKKLSFDPNILSAKIVAAKGDFVALEFVYRFEIVPTVDSGLVPEAEWSNYEGLSDVMVPRHSYKIYRGLEMMDIPEFSAGRQTLGLSPVLSGELPTGGTFNAVNTMLEFTSATAGVYKATDGVTGEQHRLDVSLSRTRDTLSYTFEKYTQTVRYGQFFNNQSAYIRERGGDSPFILASIATLPSLVEPTQADYMRTFYIDTMDLNNKGRHLVLEPQSDGRAIIYTGGIFGPNGRWQMEDDNSMSFILPCNEETYAECLSAQTEKNVLNFKLLHKQREGYWFMREYTHYSQDDNQQWNSRITHNMQFLRVCDVCYYSSN